MKRIIEEKTNRFVIKKSIFTSSIYYVETVEEAKRIIEEDRKKKHSNFVFAYKIGKNVLYDDDKEVPKTAGFQLLKVIEHNNLDLVLITTLREFGGIKLGVSNLSKAFYESGRTLTENNTNELKKGKKIAFNTSYEYADFYKNILKEYQYEISFKDQVTFIAEVDEEFLTKLNTEYEIIEEVFL